LNQNSKAKAELIEYKAAFEDATEQLRALSGQVQLTADETEIMSMQQQIRELQSTVELTQNDLNNEQKRMELMEQENLALKQEAEGLQEINSQLIQLQSELSQSALEIASLRDQCKVRTFSFYRTPAHLAKRNIFLVHCVQGGKVAFSAATGNLSSISQKDLEKLKAKLEAAEGKVKQSSQDKAAWTAEKAQLDNQVKKLTKSNQLLEKEVRLFLTMSCALTSSQ
jgi:predicted nuclease with TOPRIM domain